MGRLACLAALLAGGSALADDWPAFRGPAGTGASPEKSAPVEWGPGTNIKWKTALPAPGNGSPIVSNGRVFLTLAEGPGGRKRSLLCFDRADGKLLWTRSATHDREMPTHKTNPHGSSTPAADGKRVVAWHASAGLFCYDFEGNELWSRDLGAFRHMWGHGGSPVLSDGRVYLNAAPGEKTFVAALDLADGSTIWKTDEPFEGTSDRNPAGKYRGSWPTPVLHGDQVIVTHPTRVVGYDTATGRILWWAGGVNHPKGDLAYSSPSIAGDVVVAIGGFGGPGLGVRLGGRGDVTQSHRLWRVERNPQSIGSGVVVDGKLYVPFAAKGLIACIDPKTGEPLWTERAGRGPYWGSMVHAAGRIYVTDQEGATAVLKPDPAKLDLVALNELGEKCNATPAVSDGEIFIRTFERLWCIASP